MNTLTTALSMAAAALPATAFPAQPGARELIRDRHFRQGFVLLKPEPGKVVHACELRWGQATVPPVWRLAQWSSRFTLGGIAPRIRDDGTVSFGNEAKQVIVALRSHADGELVLGLNGSAEYGTRARRRGENWPHLLVSQRFLTPPPLPHLAQARFTIAVRLRASRLHRTPDYTPRLHAAQFQVFFNVQNLTRESAGYGDFLYFGIPLYDSRHRVPKAFHNPDQVGKFIYTLPGETYTDKSVADGEWVTVDKDLLPLMRQALEAAWKRGFLQDSRRLSDYRIAAMNLGWEMPGILDAAVQVRDLSLVVTPIETPVGP